MSRAEVINGEIRITETDEAPTLSVPSRELKSISYSQARTYRRCKRRWAGEKLLKIRLPETKALQLGIRHHKPIEVAYKTGQAVSTLSPSYFGDDVPRDRIAAAVANLPVPPGTPGVEVEHRFSIPLTGDITMNGSIDWRYNPLIVDHKTASNVEALRENPVDLLNDDQILIYAEVTFRELDPPSVEASHNTISTRHKARVLPLKWVKIPRALAAERWAVYPSLAVEMASLAASPPDFYEIEPNTEACFDYHRECPFLKICSLKPLEIGVPYMAADSTASSELLRKLGLLPTTTPEIEPPALLSPDHPSRETPPEPEKKAKAKAKPKKSKAKNEYIIEKLHGEELSPSYLEAFAEDGWDLIGVYNGAMVFKRPVTE